MRLHRLRLTAFQAFAASQEVDFDALSEAGLFLLHGDTGAGKTTLLDAVCFALYGQVPGARGRDVRVRSDHAGPGLRTEVELEVTLRERRLRVVRRPAQQRPKLRGEGVTEDPPACTVQELDAASGEWTTVAARPDEARHELEALLGMSCEQFCQLVLLPQGEFARFLNADSRERLPLLERLFGTDRFADVERWLTERRKAAWSELQAAERTAGELLARVAEVANEDAPGEVERGQEWLAGLGVRAEAELVSAGDARRSTAPERAAAEAALAAAREQAERLARHAAAVEELSGWEARRPERDRAESQLAAARRAAPLAGLLGGALVIEGRMSTTGGQSSPGELRGRAAQARGEAGALEALVAVEARLAEADRELAALERESDQAAGRVRAATAALEAAATDRASLDAGVAAARAAVERAERLEAEARTASARAGQAARRDRLAAERERAARGRSQAVDAEQAAHAAWLDLRERRIAGMAVELAAGLAPGEPCAVCGSSEHPAPAHATATSATTQPPAKQERLAQRAHERAATARAEAERDSARVEAELAATRAVAGEESADALGARAAALGAELAEARETAGTLPAHERALAALATRVAECERSGREAAQAEATARATHAERAASLAADRARVEQARGEAGTVAERAATLHAEAGAAEREAAAREAGFAGADAARAALRDDDATVALAQQVERYDAGLAERRALVEELGRASAPAVAPDLPALEAQATAATATDEQATRREALAEQRVAALRRLAGELAEALATLAPIAERERTIRELAGLVDGSSPSNRLHMRLSAYVLAARLEEVAAAATVRLERMSNGRYQLVHTDERAHRERRAGLELRVVDGWTGQRRPPRTLSGGETFLASLALALGLADVVAAEAGGSRLETLFVDEGFGSLDERTLDEVLDVLDRLREGGRAVGIVSHVAELRQRIPARLRVVKGRAGSRVEREHAALHA